ncbi:MAG TPA: hypothetical protein VHO06_08280 [Polyangia bacterium]|nr:hypothetical protein [Polyangia bacterium]
MKTMMCLGVLALLVGCDASKAELDQTKTTLSSVTHERDDLKAQVATLQQQLSSTKAELAKEKTAEAAAADKNAKPAMASKATESSSSAKNKHAHKS